MCDRADGVGVTKSSKDALYTCNWKASPNVYAAKFCPSQEGLICCGGTGGSTGARIFDYNDDTSITTVNLPDHGGVYSVDWHPSGTCAAVAGNSTYVRVMQRA